MATYVMEDDLMGLGDGQIVRDRRTGQLGLLVEVDDDEDAEIGYDDDDDDDTVDDWVGGDEDDDDEVGARRRRGGGRKRRKARRANRQEARQERREDRQERRQSRREEDMPSDDDLVNRTLVAQQTVTGAGNLNITITPQDDFWIDDITASGLANTTITMIRSGDDIIEDWPDGLDIANMAPTLATKRFYGQGGFCRSGLSIRITGSFPGAGTTQVQVHGRTYKKTRC